MPSGTIALGASVSGSVTATCEGAAHWEILDSQGNRVDHGTTSCNKCSSSLFSFTPKAEGAYSVSANFSKEGYGVLASSASEFFVTNGSGSAALIGGSSSVIAVAVIVGAWSRRTRNAPWTR